MSVNNKTMKELESYIDMLIKESYIPKEYDVKKLREYILIDRAYQLLEGTKDYLSSDILNECFIFYLEEMTYRITGEGIIELAKELFLFVELYNDEDVEEPTISNVLSNIQFTANSKLVAEEIKEFHTSFFADDYIELFKKLKNDITLPDFETSVSKEKMIGKAKTTSEEPLFLYKQLYEKIINCSIYKEEETFYLAIIFETFRKNIEEKRINARIASDMFVAELKDYIRYKYQSKNISKEVQKLLTETSINLFEIKLVANAFEHNPLEVKKSEVDFFSSLPPLKIPERKDSTEIDLEAGELSFRNENTSKVWGTQASGILLISEPDDFAKTNRFVLLQKRASWVSGGAGKWAPPGGAFNPEKFKGGELELAKKIILKDSNIESISSIEYEKSYDTDNIPLKLDPNNKDHLQLFLASAVQEFKEEVGVDLNSIGDYRVLNISVTQKDDWNYVTFVISISPDQKDTVQANLETDSESDAVMWVPIEDIIFKEGPGRNLWDVAFNENILNILKKEASGIIEVYNKSNVKDEDIPSRESIKKILGFLKQVADKKADSEEMFKIYNSLDVDKNDLYKALIAIGIHTSGKQGTKLLRNIENLKTFNYQQKLYEILSLNAIELISKMFNDNKLTNRKTDLKDVVIASRIIRRFHSLKNKDSKSETVYRGINLNDLNDSLDMMLSLINPGSKYFLGRNVSTTKSPGVARDFSSGLGVLYKIKIPDSLAASLDKISKFPAENEVLISGTVEIESFILTYENVKIGENYFNGEVDNSNMGLVKKLVKYCESAGYGSLSATVNCTLISE